MSRDSTNVAKQSLLATGDISEQQLKRMMSGMMSRQIDRGELFFQCIRNENWSLEEGLVKNAGYSLSKGIGARAISGEKSGFAYADDIQMGTLEQTASAARSIAKLGLEKRT